MTGAHLLRFVRSCLGLLASTTIQGAITVSVGGALAYVAILAGCPLHFLPVLLLCGMAVPQWPLCLYFSPDRELERKFTRWDRWVQKGYLTKAQCRQLKDKFFHWYASRVPSVTIGTQRPGDPEQLPVDEHVTWKRGNPPLTDGEPSALIGSSRV
jgi:hypothetical protein